MKRFSIQERTRGISLLEVIISIAICMPIIYIMWNSFLSGRKSEKITIAFAGALRGSAILEQLLRNDVNLTSPQTTESSITFSRNEMSLTIVQKSPEPSPPFPQSSGNEISFEPFSSKKTIQYTFKHFKTLSGKDFYKVLRNKKIVAGVVISDIDVTTIPQSADNPGGMWVAIDYTAYDEGLSRKKNGGLYSYSTTILGRIPITSPSSTFANYTEKLKTSDGSTPSAWVEGIDDRYIHIGAWAGKDNSSIPTVSIDINGNNFPVIFPDRPENHIEKNGTASYLTMSFDYETAMRLTGGSHYLNELFNITLYVVSPDTKEETKFFEESFRPAASDNFDINNLILIKKKYGSSLQSKGLHLYLSEKSSSNRPCYRLVYNTSTGKQITIGRNLSNGFYYAFLEGFPETGALERIQIESSFLGNIQNEQQ